MSRKFLRDKETVLKLKSENPIYSEMLSFYKRILDIREDYIDRLQKTLTPVAVSDNILITKIKEGFPLIDTQNLQVDYSLMNRYFLKLLFIVDSLAEKDMEKLTALAADENEFKAAIQETLRGEKHADYPDALTFFLMETIHPVLEVHASTVTDRPELKDWTFGYCPICGNQPMIGILQGEEGKKYLVCGSCYSKWSFPRIKCHNCRTEDPAYLSYLRPEENSRHRIEICDNCRTYLKVIDLRPTSQDIDADIENLVTLHLDIIARKKGYTRENFLIMN